MSGSKLEADFWNLLNIFESEARRNIIRLLLHLKWRSLSDIAEKLENNYNLKMTLPGLLKRLKQLEEAGIIRHESGVFNDNGLIMKNTITKLKRI